MAPRTDAGPRFITEGQTPDYNDSTPHDVYMRQLATRVRWHERHRHWWIRDQRRPA